MSAEPRRHVQPAPRGSAKFDRLSLSHAVLLWFAFAAISLAVLQPALRGAFINDDYSLVVNHPYLNPFNQESLIAILDPFGGAAIHGVNYAPVMLLLHALEKALFDSDTLGYHVVNAVVHALGCVLLIALLIATRVHRLAALLAGLIFAVHPANVEAVAWISQLKTNAALVFALGAVLSQRHHPALALALFALGLLTKASAMTALPMAATSYGVSAFQEPEPVDAILDPWWIGGFLAAALLAWRTVAALRARRAEAAYWLAAATSFAPISQIWPFMHPMADRYLYFILPGLIGGSLLAATEFRTRWCAAIADRKTRIRWTSIVRGLVAFSTALVVIGFGIRSHARAALWQEEVLLLRNSALHYPNGANASYYRALLAAQQRDAQTAVRELRAAADRSLGHMARFSADPRFEPISREPVFHELIDDIAGRWIEFARSRGLETQTWLRSTGQAHRARGEYREAIDCFERALRLGGPLHSVILIDLESTRAQWRQARKASTP